MQFQVLRILGAFALFCLSIAPGSAAALVIEASNATGDLWQRPAIYHSEDDGTGLANTGELEYFAQGIQVSEAGIYTLSIVVDYAATLHIYEGGFFAPAPLENNRNNLDLFPINQTLTFEGELLADVLYVFVFSGFDTLGTFGPATGNFSLGLDGPGDVTLASVPAPAAGLLLISALIAGGFRRNSRSA